MCSVVLSTSLLFVFGVAPSSAQPTAMPSATLERIDGTTVQLQNAAGETATVLIFWSNQCPWVERYQSRIQQLVDEFQDQGVQFLLVNANDASAFPQESLESSRDQANAYAATYGRDSNASLAHSLGATRTPHVFVYDGDHALAYSGAIDDSPSSPEDAENAYLEDVLTALVNGNEVPVQSTSAFGCTIKFPNS